MPYLPVELNRGPCRQTELALVDSGATVNVLPHAVGLQLGAAWDQQTIRVELSGNLAGSEARGLLLSVSIVPFPPVELAFAWTRSDDVPIILGQMNFFQEFDVCFFRGSLEFEVKPHRPSRRRSK
jgi:hypothetical protein